MTPTVTIFSVFFVLFGVVHLQKESIHGIRSNISRNHGVGKTRNFRTVRDSSLNVIRYSDDDQNNCKQCTWLGDQDEVLFKKTYMQEVSGACIKATITCTSTTNLCPSVFVTLADGSTPIDQNKLSTIVLECKDQTWRYGEQIIGAVGCGLVCGGGAYPNTTTSTTTPTTTTVTTTPEPTTSTTTPTTTTVTTTTPEPTTTTPEPTSTTPEPTTTTELTTTTPEPTTSTTTPTTTTETTTTPEPTTTTTPSTTTESTTPCVTTEQPTTPEPTTTRANRGCHVAGTK